MSEQVSQFLYWAKVQVSYAYADWTLRNLVEQAFSKNPVTRVLALAKLKKEHPEIFEQITVTEVKE